MNDLGIFYSSLLDQLSDKLTAYQLHCLTPIPCLPDKSKKKLTASFTTALAFFTSRGFSQSHSLDKFIAKLVCNSSIMQHKPSVSSVSECLAQIENTFDDAFPGYAHSSFSLSILRSRLNG
jgi:hypothetical protein